MAMSIPSPPSTPLNLPLQPPPMPAQNLPPSPPSSTQPSRDLAPTHTSRLSYLETYTTFIRSNIHEVRRLESLLRNIVYIIPTHSSHSSGSRHIPSSGAITTEALHTLLNLFSTFHASLLPLPLGHRPSPTQRYQDWASGTGSPTLSLTPSSTILGNGIVGLNDPQSQRLARKGRGFKGIIYARALQLLRTLQYTQLLLEMLAKRSGDRMRWRVVVTLETIKAVCRFVMLQVTGRRGVVNTEIGGESSTLPPIEEEKPRDEFGEEMVVKDSTWKMPRTGMTLPDMPNLNAGETITGFLESRVVTADEIKSAQQLVRRLESVRANVAEAMWILRPVIYALALQRVQGNRKDWRPWMLGLAMELASKSLAKKDVMETLVGGWRGLSGVEREETKRRGAGLAWWGMRGAFYENVTGRWVKGVVGRLKGKPLLDMVGGVVEDYDWLWEEYYFSTATV